MRVVIADDHPVVLMGLRMVLQQFRSDCNVVGEAANGKALMALLGRNPCDLLITDFSMPTGKDCGDGLLLVRQIRERLPELPIIVMSMLSNPSLARGMLNEGVNAVVEKAAVAKELTAAIPAVLSGHTYVSSALFTKLATDSIRSCNPSSATSLPLSPYEAEVVRLLARGLTVSDIAGNTGRSVKTVSQQKHAAMRKLDIDGDAQLFEYALAHGL